MSNRIPLDPVLPENFDDIPNDERDKAQLDAWWDHPYGITQPDGKIIVRCLNGGAWDRSSVLGVADNYDEACELAEKEQAGENTITASVSIFNRTPFHPG
ncbi:DNA-binding protein (plasmid) [Escherichia albertii]|uniref:DNA-binding protein n=1 Tax=Escherichia albertii TaxID=208962 RepID=UPI0023613391|nr:DNA-binding protein [Escherichia albertii]MCZ8963440.1 DNA-binding protein [Escherichia albertii]MCZ9016756.1 DNA-binding protein [Escherichia albertii]MCZ9075190.1 DNA-binding protein [Escherichia albertii]MCZ9135269.1 DNA-binding protein [Escherichia albertii]MCZ9187807.1 DNA-binding protein [Escherichia albertii]